MRGSEKFKANTQAACYVLRALFWLGVEVTADEVSRHSRRLSIFAYERGVAADTVAGSDKEDS
jgi:hypothetical protein